MEARRELGQPTLSMRGTGWCVGRGQKEGLGSRGPGAKAQRCRGSIIVGTMAVGGYRVEGQNEVLFPSHDTKRGAWGLLVPIPLLLERVSKALWFKEGSSTINSGKTKKALGQP